MNSDARPSLLHGALSAVLAMGVWLLAISRKSPRFVKST
jgi:hypothetical protein